MALLLAACGTEAPKPIPKAEALRELPKAENVTFIEIRVGSHAPVNRIEDPKVIAAALDFLGHELDGWTKESNIPIGDDGVFAAVFVRNLDFAPCGFSIDKPDRIVVMCPKSGGEISPGFPATQRFKSILGIR